LISLVVSALVGSSVGADNCTVGENAELIFSKTSFANIQDTDGDTVLIQSEIVGGDLKLVGVGSAQSANAWIDKQEMLGDGFIAEFGFTIDGQGDGVAFVAQNYQTFDTLGGSASNLGFLSRTENYLAVGFETFDVTQQVVVSERDNSGTITTPGTFAVPNGIDLNDGQKHVARILYNLNGENGGPEIEVYVDDTFVGKTDVQDATTNLWRGSPYAWVGFSASTPAEVADSADITVHDLALFQQPAAFNIVTDLGIDVDFGRSILIELETVDSCLERVAADPVIIASVSDPNVTSLIDAKLIKQTDTPPAQPVVGNDFLVPGSIIYDETNQVFAIRFDLPNLVKATWDLNITITVDGVEILATKAPFVGAIESVEPIQEGGLPTWGLALLIAIICIIILALIYSIVRLRRYKKKLEENAEDIEAGKEKHMLDILDRTVEYKMNPMLGSLEDMKAKLRENERELEKLKQGNGGYDDDYTIESLQKQNAELRAEMNNLKKKAQQEEAVSTNYRPNLGPAEKTPRRQFGQERANKY